jgi:hypothetical protein
VTAGRVLFWSANACLMLFLTDLVLLIVALGLRALDRSDDEPRE